MPCSLPVVSWRRESGMDQGRILREQGYRVPYASYPQVCLKDTVSAGRRAKEKWLPLCQLDGCGCRELLGACAWGRSQL